MEKNTIKDIMEKTTIAVKHKTRCMDTPKALKGEENPCKEYNTTFDFSNCTEEEILNLASRTCIIAFRTKCKVNSITEEAFGTLANKTIDVHEELKAERRGLSNAEKAEKALTSLSEEERADILKKLLALTEKRA